MLGDPGAGNGKNILDDSSTKCYRSTAQEPSAMLMLLVPAYRRRGEHMYRLKIPFFYEIGFHIESLQWIKPDTPTATRQQIIEGAIHAVSAILSDNTLKEIIPRSVGQLAQFLGELRSWQLGLRTDNDLPGLQHNLRCFSVILTEDIDRTYSYTLTSKGNLSIDNLVSGASNGYPERVRQHLDAFMIREIDEAGKCLACALCTACGFHILRAVEIGIKAYVHAATGSLPAVKQRNWGEYMRVLGGVASNDFIDLLKLLKAKRNPLMHPQDTLDQDDAIDLLCICQSVIGSLTSEIQSHSLSSQFAASLKALPNL